MKLKRLREIAGVSLVSLALLELLSRLLFEPISGLPFAPAALHEQQQQRIAALEAKLHEDLGADANFIFHPYLGYAGRPGASPWSDGPPFNAFGMLSVAGHPFPYVPEEGDFVLAVVGGSVAEIFANRTEDHLRANLEALGFEERLVVLSLATGGYKQPQQLFHLQYAILSGFHIDAVLNLDGFNDIVFAAENLDNDLSPVFPSGAATALIGKTQIQEKLDYETLVDMVEYLEAYRTEAWVLSLARRAPLRYSAFWNLAVESVANALEARISRLRHSMVYDAQDSMEVTLRGPRLALGDDVYEVGAEIWRKSSEMIHQLARANGIPYIHALQPNQYVSGSKRLTEQEQQVAIRSDGPYVRATEGYPYLVEKGRQLSESGVAFYDLRMVFADNDEDLYYDSCCHFNQRGNEILAEALAPILLEQIERQRVAGSVDGSADRAAGGIER